MKIFKSCAAAMCVSVALCAPAFAQDGEAPAAEMPNRGVFAGDWVTLGLGAGYGPSYDGSDEYVLFPAPLIQGSVGGFDFGARGPGLYVDLIADGNSDKDVKFLAGPLLRFRMDRNSDVKDPVVRLLGKKDVAIEVGATAGVSFSGILDPFDTVTISSDIQWDVAGAHKGRLISPSISYATPLSKAIFTMVSLSATHVDGNYADTYFSIDQAGSIASGLPVFDAKGGSARSIYQAMRVMAAGQSMVLSTIPGSLTMPHDHRSHRCAATQANGLWRAGSAIPFDARAALERVYRQSQIHMPAR